jgi:TetR/AcrR family transcriptional repressor of nem operon
MTGRPRTFDETEALEAAMRVFWAQGYDATSFDDLVQQVGIGRQSFYSTFGDKRSLYVKAVEHYGKTVTQRAVDLLGSAGSPTGNIRRWFARLSDVATGDKRFGCLITNTAVELAPSDPAMAKLVMTQLQRVESALYDALERAVDLGELAQETDTRALASYLLNAAQGLLVMSKLRVSQKKLSGIADVTLSVLLQEET